MKQQASVEIERPIEEVFEYWMMNKSGCKAAERELLNLKRRMEERSSQPLGQD